MRHLPALLLAAPALLAQAPVDYPALQKEAAEALKAARSDRAKALEALRARASKAKGEEAQALLIMQWSVALQTRDEQLSQDLAKRIQAEVAPASPAWQVVPELVPSLKYIPGFKDTAYVGELKAKGAPAVRALVEASEVENLLHDGRVPEARTVLARLSKAYPGTPAVAKAEKALQATLKAGLYVGQPAPDFAVQNLHKPGETFTKASFKGKVLLVDFWATWCGWCVKELPHTHKLYAEYKGKGLEILSISADRDPKLVKDFQTDPKMPMPWKHACLAEPKGKNPVANAFGVTGYPTLYLIGRDGKILAKGSDLREEKLGATLARVLGK